MPRSGRRAARKPRSAASYSRSMREEHAFRWRYALLIVLVALAFRGAYVAEAAREPSWNLLYLDEEYHVGWAKSLATGDFQPPYDQLRAAPYFRAPLYPYFLAGVFRLFGTGLLVPRLIQILIGSLSCALAYALGAKCFDQRVGLITGFVCALYWVLAYHDAEFLLPVLLVFFVLLGFVLAFAAAERRSPGLAMLAGLSFGLFSVTRPNILVFFPFAAWWGVTIARRMSPRRGAAFATLLALGMLHSPRFGDGAERRGGPRLGGRRVAGRRQLLHREQSGVGRHGGRRARHAAHVVGRLRRHGRHRRGRRGSQAQALGDPDVLAQERARVHPRRAARLAPSHGAEGRRARRRARGAQQRALRGAQGELRRLPARAALLRAPPGPLPRVAAVDAHAPRAQDGGPGPPAPRICRGDSCSSCWLFSSRTAPPSWPSS